MNIALTELMEVFHVDAPTVQWLATGFMLVMGVLMPISALLIQWFTTRQMFIGVMSIFSRNRHCRLCSEFPDALDGAHDSGSRYGTLDPHYYERPLADLPA
ncbi:hypothetical protein PO124_18900 [Bacillus licheniformis]|nr:hypothetical protein [Bacillus licheniformis]